MSTPQLISEECVWTIVTDPGKTIFRELSAEPCKIT